MVYIGSNGSLQEKKKFTFFGFLAGIFKGAFDIVGLFFSSVTGNPHQITVRSLVAVVTCSDENI
jgi:hypothetical protein